MKRTLWIVLACTTLAASLTLPSPVSQISGIPLVSSRPDPRFTIRTSIESTLLPPNAALVNVLHFMGIIAEQSFTQELAPRTYSAPEYRQVQITSYAHTEARFLLWAVYMAITQMIQTVRFHNTLLDLFWVGSFVGRIRIAVKPGINLPGASGNGSRILLDDGYRKSWILVEAQMKLLTKVVKF